MPTLNRWPLVALALAAGALFAPEARACTTATANIDLGSHSSYSVAATVQQGSGSAGLQCDILLAALTTHYVGLRVDASSFILSGPGGSQIAYIASLAPNGTPLAVGSFQNLSSTSLLSLFGGTNNSIPIYVRTAAAPGLRAGTYTGTIDLRWYYSVCSLGVALCLSYSNSPGFVRPVPIITAINWGTGVAVRVNVELRVENDCLITAPDLDFGSAPLAGSFDPVTRTILIRCSAGADSNAGVYDSVTTQGFAYRAEILPGQTTPAAGSYTDTIRIDVDF